MSVSPTAAPPAPNFIPSVVNSTNNELMKRGRVKTPADLVSGHMVLWNADWASSQNRALIQSMMDGVPPFREGANNNRGMAGRSNVNWGLATAALKTAQMPYVDILDGLDVFGRVPTDHGTKEQQQLWNPIISEEITRMLRKWKQFNKRWQQNALLFVNEGLSFAFFDDDIDWRWSIYGQQFLKFARRTRADVEELDILTCQVDMLPNKLFRSVEDPTAAEENGWNRKAVLDAIKTACPHGIAVNDPQEWERAWKDNDIIYGTTQATVQTVHGWVKELDGTVSHYIARYDAQGDWLYKSEGKFRCMSSLLIDYAYGIGTNGDFQSIRGLGGAVFNSAGGINRLLCKYLDMAVHVSTPHIINKNEDSIQENAIRPYGPYAVMMDGLEFAEQKMPSFEQTLEPAIAKLEGIFQVQASPYAPTVSRELDRTQRTATEIETQNEQNGKLTTGGVGLFFDSWEVHFKEIVRRISREDYAVSDPGGQEVWNFRKRCVKRGVPLEAIFAIDVDAIEINTGFGKGSAAERRSVMAVLNDRLYDRADSLGKNRISNMTAAAYAGSDIANELFPPQEGLRPPNADVHTAMGENNFAAQGMPIEVLVNDNHTVHLQTHLTRLAELNDGLANMQLQLEEAIPQMSPLFQHCNEHMQFMDPMSPMTADFRQGLQQLGEVVTNGQKHIDAEAQKAAKAAGEEVADGYGGIPASDYKQAVQAQKELNDLNLDTQRQELSVQADRAKKVQDLAHQQAKNRIALAAQQGKAAIDIRAKAAKEKTSTKKPTSNN